MDKAAFEAILKGMLKSTNIKKAIGDLLDISLVKFQTTSFFKKKQKSEDDFKKNLVNILISIDGSLKELVNTNFENLKQKDEN